MRRVLLLFILLSLPVSVSASWALVPLGTLVQESDIIVVGTLRDVVEHSADGVDYGRGRIEVREVIWGSVSPGDTLQLKWDNASAIICPRVEHKHNQGEEGIWLLTRDGDAVRAEYPGRFVELSERRQVETALARSPVVLRGNGYRVVSGEPMPFSVVYRNVAHAPREFPGVAFEGGRLRLAHGSRLSVRASLDGEERHAALSNRVTSERGLAPVKVAPRGEHRVEVDLRELLGTEPLAGESYDVALRLGGRPPTNELSFYVGEQFYTQPAAVAPVVSPVEKRYDLNITPARPKGLAPLTRAGLTALAALLLFPFFRKLRAALVRARLARVAHGAQTWQI